MSDKTQHVRERAYRLWQEQGEPQGLETDHWLQAEHETNEGDGSQNEGEGNQTGAREYDEATTAFVRDGKVPAAAAKAVESLNNPAEAAEMKKAEEAGKKRSHGEDPALKKTRR